MTGMHARFGWPIWACRLSVEGSVLVLGWLLGGTVGIGTVVFALGIGPLVHIAMPLLAAPKPAPRRPARRESNAHEATPSAPRGQAATPAACRRQGDAPPGDNGTDGAPVSQCSRNSGRSLPGLRCE